MTQTKTDETQTPPAGEKPPTDAERLVSLELDNKGLRDRIVQLEDMGVDAETREARLQEAEKVNRKLQAEHGEAVLREALRSAAKTLELDGEMVLNLYSHKFKVEVQPSGQVRIEPNPTETLAKALREDPFLKRGKEGTQQREEDRAVVQDPDATAARLLQALDRDPTKKNEYIKKYGGDAYMKLAQADRLARRAKRNA